MALASVLLLAGCTTAEPTRPSESTPTGASPLKPEGGPLAGAELYVNPESTAWTAARQLRDSGDPTAETVMEIARTPTGTWFGGESDPRQKAERITRAADQAGQVPVLVAYNLPERDCGQYSKGGAGSNDDYRVWAGEVAAGIGDRAAIVVLEPDAIAHAIEGCDGAEMAVERYALLSDAVDIFTAQPRVSLYIDAGNATWIDDTEKVAGALRESGVERASGFALNVSNFAPTDASYAYGERVSQALGGDVRFVIDTSRNGGQTADGDWCNPVGAKLGEPPTTTPEQPLLDALLWVKQPGDSDGDSADRCRGGPPAGQWWQDYAVALAT